MKLKSLTLDFPYQEGLSLSDLEDTQTPHTWMGQSEPLIF